MEETARKMIFPKDFYWGSSTSAHQVEGGNHNDWTEFERANAERLAFRAKRRVWPEFLLNAKPSPLDPENYISGRACDHYHRFREDFDIARSLGHNAHRFTIEWSRIEPEEGKFNVKEIEHYRGVILELRKRGIEPFVTLWHFTLPVWFARKGGFEKEENITYFLRYLETTCEALKDGVRYIIVFNEPSMWAGQAYFLGIWPPQKHNLYKTARVYFNLQKAQRLIYNKLKKINPDFQIGISENVQWFGPELHLPLVNYLRNMLFLKRVSKFLDFIGVNYYMRLRLFHGKEKHSDLGWEIYPRGFYKLLLHMKSLGKPIYITENGVADLRDKLRARFIEDHIFWMKRAMDEGADVRGYFHWSLLDNFEWDSGFWPRFGLVEVDYRTQERKIRESARVYSDIIRNAKS